MDADGMIMTIEERIEASRLEGFFHLRRPRDRRQLGKFRILGWGWAAGVGGESRKGVWKEGRKGGRKEGREEGRKEGRKAEQMVQRCAGMQKRKG